MRSGLVADVALEVARDALPVRAGIFCSNKPRRTGSGAAGCSATGQRENPCIPTRPERQEHPFLNIRGSDGPLLAGCSIRQAAHFLFSMTVGTVCRMTADPGNLLKTCTSQTTTKPSRCEPCTAVLQPFALLPRMYGIVKHLACAGVCPAIWGCRANVHKLELVEPQIPHEYCNEHGQRCNVAVCAGFAGWWQSFIQMCIHRLVALLVLTEAQVVFAAYPQSISHKGGCKGGCEFSYPSLAWSPRSCNASEMPITAGAPMLSMVALLPTARFLLAHCMMPWCISAGVVVVIPSGNGSLHMTYTYSRSPIRRAAIRYVCVEDPEAWIRSGSQSEVTPARVRSREWRRLTFRLHCVGVLGHLLKSPSSGCLCRGFIRVLVRARERVAFHINASSTYQALCCKG